MTKVNVEDRGNVAILRLNNGVTNAISPLLVDDLFDRINEIKNGYKGMVLAGGTKFFSIGLDLPELLKLDRATMTDFCYKFNRVVFDLFTLPLPTVCAIIGHAVAGGTVFALTCDYRFAASGKEKVGLNEVKLGVPVPYVADLALRLIVGDRTSAEILYQGNFMPVSNAKEIGLIDDIFPQETVEDEATEKAAELAALPELAFAAIKANRVETIRVKYEKNYKLRNEIFLDCWFSEPVQELLKEATRTF